MGIDPSDGLFQDGVADVWPTVHRLFDGPRVVRRADGGVTLLRMDDVLAVTKRRDVHSMDPASIEFAASYIGAGRPLIPLMLDGEAHTKYRKLLDPLFAPKVVADLEPRVRALSDELIDRFVGDGRVEFFEAFCEPLPTRIFLAQLGLPIDDLPFLLWFKDGIIRPVDDEHRVAANTKMVEYLYAELDRRAATGDPGDDLIGGFITAEVDGERLTREDVVDITFLLVLAGLDTVSATLSCMVAWFARHPEQRQRVLDDPGLLPAAIEELLRVETPVVGGGRHATADFELGGEQIRAGDRLRVLWAAANVDDGCFDDPLAVDFDRPANRHVAFASGFHRCLGSHLARLELRVALAALHDRIPDYALDADAPPSYNNGAIRTVNPLPLVFTPG
ncbi:MAG TPA: cytochrome P450 [Acidimicrobiia bacterium]|nr:cytochrome P450 [Acidimicrobiia bacterium]